MSAIVHLTFDELQAAVATLDASPHDEGTVALIVCRPDLGVRQVLAQAEVSEASGVVGDNWFTRGSKRTEDGSAHPEMQITLMNSRIIHLIAQDEARWQLAGDQFFVDFDLSEANLPVGQRIALGDEVILEISTLPHTGCQKFTERFGSGAIKFVNSPAGREARYRGINARVIQGGTVTQGDVIRKLE